MNKSYEELVRLEKAMKRTFDAASPEELDSQEWRESYRARLARIQKAKGDEPYESELAARTHLVIYNPNAVAEPGEFYRRVWSLGAKAEAANSLTPAYLRTGHPRWVSTFGDIGHDVHELLAEVNARLPKVNRERDLICLRNGNNGWPPFEETEVAIVDDGDQAAFFEELERRLSQDV